MIFISYGHDEHENLIRKIAEDLRKDNIEVWIDYDCLYGSSQWEQKIETGDSGFKLGNRFYDELFNAQT